MKTNNRKDEADQRAQFGARVKEQEVVVPTQTVEFLPKQRTKGNEVQLNVHVDSELLKRLKIKGLNEDKNIKQMISEAISVYLGQ